MFEERGRTSLEEDGHTSHSAGRRTAARSHAVSQNNGKMGTISALCILGAILIACNIALIRQNANLKSGFEGNSLSDYFTPGDRLPPLQGSTISGGQMEFNYGESGKKTLILVYSPTCVWCRKNLNNWVEIVRNIDREKFQVVAVSTVSEGNDKFYELGVFHDVPMIMLTGQQELSDFKLHSTPQTIVVDEVGNAEEIWIGAFNLDQEADIERYFGLDLPGLG